MAHITTNTTTIKITGMHCASCDILVKLKLKVLHNITEVVPNRDAGLITITHKGALSLDEINGVLCEYGYKVYSADQAVVQSSEGSMATTKSPGDLQETLGIAAILCILYYFANQFDLLSSVATTSSATTSGAFVLGLIASISTCMATTGAVFTSFVNKQAKTQVLMTALSFMIGRVLSYGAFGYALALFGGAFLRLVQFGSGLNLLMAAILILVGLDMLHLVSLGKILSYLPGRHLLLSLEEKRSKSLKPWMSATLLGGLTYLLPCGFTLSTQAYALTLGNPVQSALLMMAFALGTLPALLGITLLSKVRTHHFYYLFLKVVALIIIAVGLGYVANTAELYGYRLISLQSDSFAGESAPIENGKQIVKMTARSAGYFPSEFVVKAGIPVEWQITGKEINGCQGTIQAPKVGVSLVVLKEGENKVEFTPVDKGYVTFSCSMGMFSGRFKVI
ncbi:MAG: sulfite exporter TauE/SafE family protein [bacterium]